MFFVRVRFKKLTGAGAPEAVPGVPHVVHVGVGEDGFDEVLEVVLAVVLHKRVQRLGALVPEHAIKKLVHIVLVEEELERLCAILVHKLFVGGLEFLSRAGVHALEGLHLCLAFTMSKTFT